MNLATIDSTADNNANKQVSQADFDKYFSENDIFKLFEYTPCQVNSDNANSDQKSSC